MENNTLQRSKAASDLLAAWKAAEEKFTGIRIKEAAALLNSSEAELLALKASGTVVRLKSDWSALLKRLPELGRIMSLTRNNSCILEHKGAFEKVSVFGKGDHQMATVLGAIETRVFLSAWHVAFAVQQEKNGRELTSIQVFDKAGHAVTKIYLQEDSNFNAFEKIVQDFQSDDQETLQALSSFPSRTYDHNFDKNAFLEDWSKLKDTHDFFHLLNKYKADRFQAIETAEGVFSHRIAITNIQTMLEQAANQKLPIMVFAGNKGNLQIHQDKVRTIRLLDRGHHKKEQWLNILDPDFNMHLRLDLITSAWIVTKPTTDGEVTSIECFDDKHELAVQFFGLRKPGEPELEAWKALVNSLKTTSEVL